MLNFFKNKLEISSLVSKNNHIISIKFKEKMLKTRINKKNNNHNNNITKINEKGSLMINQEIEYKMQ